MQNRSYLFITAIIFLAVTSIVFFLPISQAQGGRATPRPTSTPRPTTYYVNGNTINARSCPETTCEVVTTFRRGAAIRVLGSETGTNVSGSTIWYRARYQGQNIYVHSSLVSLTRPTSSASSSSVQPTRASDNSSSNSNSVQPTSVPAEAVVPAAPPTENVSVAPPAASYSCNCSKTCEQMASCDEAYFQLNQCGCGRRDGDGDGVPCESICSGG